MAEHDDFDELDGFEDEYQDDELGELDDSIAEEDAGQSEGKRKAQAKKFNLFESDEFRAWQATQDKRVAELETKYQREAEERERVMLAKMTEQEKRDYGQRKLAQENDELRQKLQEQEMMAYRAQVVADIRAETGAPLDALDLSSEAALVRSAFKWQRDNDNSRPGRRSRDDEYSDDEDSAEERPPRRRRTDLGQGRTRKHTPEMRLKAEYQKALKAGSVWDAIQISDRAMQQGINLNPEG